MARLSVPRPDPSSLFESFDSNPSNLSGEIAEISFSVRSESMDIEQTQGLQAAFDDSAFLDLVLAAAEDQVRKGLGSDYRIDVFDVDTITHSIRLTVATLFDQTSSTEATAKGIANVTADLGAEIASILSERFKLQVRVRPKWDPGEGLNAPLNFTSAETFAPALEEHRRQLRARRAHVARTRWRLVLGGVVLVSSLVVLIAIESHRGYLFVISLYAALAAVIVLVTNLMLGNQLGELDDDIREAGNELDVRRIETDQGEARAQKLFQSHAFEIKRYYDQALRQGRSIYYVGIICIGLGFAVIGTSFVLISHTDSTNLSGQVIVGALGAIGAILANFIAVVYLRMFSETVQALTSFHQRLVVTHHLHFGNFLASKIKHKATREAALAEMSKGLSMAARIDFAAARASGNGGVSGNGAPGEEPSPTAG